MLKNIVSAALCIAAPTIAVAQQVELQSADGLISVEGSIVGFDGENLSVQTSVGQVSVPASDVACIGPGCLDAIADEALGLSVETFRQIVIAGVVIDVPSGPSEPTAEAQPAPAAPGPRSDDLTVVFENESESTLFRTLAGAFAIAPGTTTQLDLDTPGQIGLTNISRNETAILRFGEDGADGDILLRVSSLLGAADFEYQTPADWSLVGPLSSQLIGLNAFAVIASGDVGLEEISVADLAAIYAGEITNWSALGGPDKRILPLQLPVESELRDEVLATVMAPLGKEVASSVLTMADEARIVESVQQFPGSISIVTLDSTGGNDVLPIRGACDIAVAPTPFNLVSGDYPLLRPFVADFETDPDTALYTQLFDFAAKPEVTQLIAADGFIDQTPVLQDTAVTNNRLVSLTTSTLEEAQRAAATGMFELLFGAERLSTTLIGGAVSGPEGAWNRSRFVALRDILATPEFAEKEVFFVGLASSSNGSAAAVTNSERIAAEMQANFGQFARDVIEANNLQLSSHGFGDVAQTACYESQVAAETYSQVEIWVR